MEIPTELRQLVERDRLVAHEFHVPTYAHDDHRFVLPLAHYAQQQGLLPRPCKVVMLDRHNDALEPRQEAVGLIRTLRSEGLDSSELMSLTDHGLSPSDDDWLVTGMELGMFTDAVVFGASDLGGRAFREFDDHLGERHRIWINASLPGECLGYQGNLSDTARSYEVAPLWDLLDWECDQGRFCFVGDEKLLVSIDLDAFVVDWEGFMFPWPAEVWERRFLKVSEYPTTAGWDGRLFVQSLVGRAGLLEVSREPKHCGGEEKMEMVFRDMNHYVFEDAIAGLDR